MNKQGEGILRKAMRMVGIVSPYQLLSGKLFAIAPGTAVMPSVPLALDGFEEAQEEERKPYRLKDSVALIPIVGPLSKHPDLFRILGCSKQMTSPELAAAILDASLDPEAKGILLLIESPGGTVEGTYELAEAVWAARQKKPIHAFAQDQAASAAYWVGSQAHRLTTNATGRIGSIGTFAVMVDSSKAADRAGLKFHRITTAPHKGAGAPGVEITPEQLEAWQRQIDDTNAVFLAGVARGRGMSLDQVRVVADGRLHVGEASVRLGLTDAVDTYEGALEALQEQIRNPSPAPSPVPEPPPVPAAKTPTAGRKELAMSKRNGRAPRRGASSLTQRIVATMASLGMLAQEVEAEWETLSGTVSIDAGATGVMGVGTMFTQEVAQGDNVRIAGEEHEVASVESDDSLTLATAHVAGATDAAIERLVPQETPDEEPAEEPAAPAEPSALDELVDRKVAKLLAPMLVEQDLAKLADTVPPAALAKARPVLVRALSEGRSDDYKATLEMLGTTDTSTLLAPPVATSGRTGSAHMVPGLSQADVAWLENIGIDPKEAARVSRKYMTRKV